MWEQYEHGRCARGRKEGARPLGPAFGEMVSAGGHVSLPTWALQLPCGDRTESNTLIHVLTRLGEAHSKKEGQVKLVVNLGLERRPLSTQVAVNNRDPPSLVQQVEMGLWREKVARKMVLQKAEDCFRMVEHRVDKTDRSCGSC